MRISDWSSDVCSSDLRRGGPFGSPFLLGVMIMADALTGYGSEFHLDDEIGVLTEVGELIALEPGSEEWGTTETTHFKSPQRRSEEHKSALKSLMRISYEVICLTKKNNLDTLQR